MSVLVESSHSTWASGVCGSDIVSGQSMPSSFGNLGFRAVQTIVKLCLVLNTSVGLNVSLLPNNVSQGGCLSSPASGESTNPRSSMSTRGWKGAVSTGEPWAPILGGPVLGTSRCQGALHISTFQISVHCQLPSSSDFDREMASSFCKRTRTAMLHCTGETEFPKRLTADSVHEGRIRPEKKRCVLDISHSPNFLALFS